MQLSFVLHFKVTQHHSCKQLFIVHLSHYASLHFPLPHHHSCTTHTEPALRTTTTMMKKRRRRRRKRRRSLRRHRLCCVFCVKAHTHTHMGGFFFHFILFFIYNFAPSESHPTRSHLPTHPPARHPYKQIISLTWDTLVLYCTVFFFFFFFFLFFSFFQFGIQLYRMYPFPPSVSTLSS